MERERERENFQKIERAEIAYLIPMLTHARVYVGLISRAFLKKTKLKNRKYENVNKEKYQKSYERR